MQTAKRKKSREETSGASSSGTADTGLPAWLPWVLYGALSLLLFGAFVFSNQMLFGSDTLGLGYMARQFYASAVRSGDFPLWNPNLLGGVPFLEAMSGGDSLSLVGPTVGEESALLPLEHAKAKSATARMIIANHDASSAYILGGMRLGYSWNVIVASAA